MAKKSSKKSVKNSPLIGLIIIAVLIAAAILFVLPQYVLTPKVLDKASYNGFELAFGADGKVVGLGGIGDSLGDMFAARFYIFLPFIFAIIAAAIVAIVSFTKILKGKEFIGFAAAALLALVSFILMIVYLASTSTEVVATVERSFSAWYIIGFILQFLAFAGSGYGAYKAFK
ncbi:MAG: hypothetical protein LBS99_05270 [Clostridiales bacterium]|jgi:hypothetical protein|nr:hypothetical protein [Clostridiales bacterium]